MYLLHVQQLSLTQPVSFIFIIIEKEKEVEDLTSQLRDRDKQNETLKQKLKGNWY